MEEKTTSRDGIAPDGRPARWARSWPRAAALSAAIVGALVVVFAVAPHRLALLVEGRGGSATLRDLVLVGWVLAWIVVVSWTLVRLQRRGIF